MSVIGIFRQLQNGMPEECRSNCFDAAAKNISDTRSRDQRIPSSSSFIRLRAPVSVPARTALEH
jgi:hypothetical protein